MDDSGPRTLFAQPLTGRRLIAFDALAAVVFTAVAVPAARDSGWPAWAQVLIALGAGGPAAVRRLWPVPVFWVVLGVSLVAEVWLGARTLFAAPAFALYTVAVTQPPRRWLPTPAIAALGAAGMFGLTATGASETGGFDPVRVLSAAGVLGGTWTIGRAVAERRAFAERSARQLAARAVVEERLRIARELHDIVTHSMGLIAIKAGVANHVAEARPQEARDALRIIESTSRGALTEMRHLLGVLRSESAGPPENGPELSPAPGVPALPGLIRRAEAAGVRVTAEVAGAEGVPEGVGLSVYRIVQEALTNVARHAPAARCRVSVLGGDGEVRVEVTDDGPGSPGTGTGTGVAGGGGHGLIGMRERAALYGGSLTAGPADRGGFRVVARLPYGRAAQRGAATTRPVS
ncbi:sensor histidine kinase [Streptomyces sp. NPDC001985]|uniref:sensor histidine kinase n=1 Tax=Streptomyces sp. NPDC001985 TaxID=3154406 RepID=UPI003333333D